MHIVIVVGLLIILSLSNMISKICLISPSCVQTLNKTKKEKTLTLTKISLECGSQVVVLHTAELPRWF